MTAGETSVLLSVALTAFDLGGGPHHSADDNKIDNYHYYLSSSIIGCPEKGCNVKITIGLGPTALLSAV